MSRTKIALAAFAVLALSGLIAAPAFAPLPVYAIPPVPVSVTVRPHMLSLGAASSTGFTVTVAGRVKSPSSLSVYWQSVPDELCAKRAGNEMTRPGASQLLPVPATPSAPQIYPANPNRFTSSYHWHGVVVVAPSAASGRYRVCAYLGKAGASSLAPPAATATATFVVS
jgi:hypothetical protein